MEFVQWCGVFLAKLLEVQEESGTASSMGVRVDELGPLLLGEGWDSAPRSEAIAQAVTDLKSIGIIEQDRRLPQYLRIPRSQRDRAVSQTALWIRLCAQDFTDDEARLLRALNRLSERRQADFAYLESVPYDELSSAIGGDAGYEAVQMLDHFVRNLDTLGYARFNRVLNRSDLGARPTYAGLVWEHRRSVTISSLEIDALVAEGETPTVDLKRQLSIDTKSEQAELIKDVIALANTKASGGRYIVIGFTDERDYYEPEDGQQRIQRDRLLNSLTEQRLQTIIANHTSPALRIQYSMVEHYSGKVGLLEILRETTDIPYEVRKTVGSDDKKDKQAKQVRAGQMFVRDGSFTREARPEEISRMQADAERAQLRQQQ